MLADTAAALHALVRGDPANQCALAAAAPCGLAAVLHRAASALEARSVLHGNNRIRQYG